MLDDVKYKLGKMGLTSFDEVSLNNIIQKVTYKINSETNLEELPTELCPMAVDMVCGEYLQYLKATNKLSEISFDKVLTSISEGDRSFSFANDGSKEKAFDTYVQSLMTIDMQQVARFRDILW